MNKRDKHPLLREMIITYPFEEQYEIKNKN